jgi:hypothetical protein
LWKGGFKPEETRFPKFFRTKLFHKTEQTHHQKIYILFWHNRLISKCWGASWTGVLDKEVSYYLSRFLLLFLIISKGVHPSIYIFKEPLWLAHREYFWNIEQPPIRSTYVIPTPQNRSIVASMWHTILVFIYIHIYDNFNLSQSIWDTSKEKTTRIWG